MGQHLDLMRHLSQQGGGQRSAEMHLSPAALAGLPHPKGGENTGHGVQQHRVESEFIRQTTGMLTTGTAVGHQHPATDVLTPMQRNAANGCGHGFHRQLQRPRR